MPATSRLPPCHAGRRRSPVVSRHRRRRHIHMPAVDCLHASWPASGRRRGGRPTRRRCAPCPAPRGARRMKKSVARRPQHDGRRALKRRQRRAVRSCRWSRAWASIGLPRTSQQAGLYQFLDDDAEAMDGRRSAPAERWRIYFTPFAMNKVTLWLARLMPPRSAARSIFSG